MLLAALALAAAAPAQGCMASLVARADGSFAEAGYDSSPERLARLAAQTRERFAVAARRLCEAGVLRPGDLKRVRVLVVQNGEGATEPLLYREAGMARGAWVFNTPFRTAGRRRRRSSSGR